MTVSCPSNGMKRNILLRRSWRLVSAPRPQILPLRTPDAWGQSWKPKRFSKARATNWSSTSLLVTSRSWTSTWTPWGQERRHSWRSLIKKKWLTGVTEHKSNSFNDLQWSRKRNQQRFWPFHENGLFMTISLNLYVNFESVFLCYGIGLTWKPLFGLSGKNWRLKKLSPKKLHANFPKKKKLLDQSAIYWAF